MESAELAGLPAKPVLDRNYGQRRLASNSVTAIEVVTADGEVRRASATNEPDLFWALRGGSGDFGALDTLPGSFLLFGVGILMDPAMKEPTLQRLASLRAAFGPWESGCYLNFSDAPADISTAFPAETVSRLRAAKQTYDSENLFHANHPTVIA